MTFPSLLPLLLFSFPYLEYGGQNSGSGSQFSFLVVILFNQIIKTPGLYINSMQINFRSSALTSLLSFRLSNSINYQKLLSRYFHSSTNSKIVRRFQSSLTFFHNPYFLQLSDFLKYHHYSFNHIEVNPGNNVTLGIQLNWELSEQLYKYMLISKDATLWQKVHLQNICNNRENRHRHRYWNTLSTLYFWEGDGFSWNCIPMHTVIPKVSAFFLFSILIVHSKIPLKYLL